MKKRNYGPHPQLERMLPELFVTSHHDSHTITDIKQKILSGFQTGYRLPFDEYNICGIVDDYTYRKNNIFMQRRPLQSYTYVWKWGQGTKSTEICAKV